MAMFRSETPCTTASMTPGPDPCHLCLPLLLLHGNSAPKYISFRILSIKRLKKFKHGDCIPSCYLHTWIRLRWRRRSIRFKRISLLYSGCPWIPMMWSLYLNISIPVFSDWAITSACGGSSHTYIIFQINNLVNYPHYAENQCMLNSYWTKDLPRHGGTLWREGGVGCWEKKAA